MAKQGPPKRRVQRAIVSNAAVPRRTKIKKTTGLVESNVTPRVERAIREAKGNIMVDEMGNLPSKRKKPAAKKKKKKMTPRGFKEGLQILEKKKVRSQLGG